MRKQKLPHFKFYKSDEYASLFGFEGELVTEIGVCYRYELLRPLTEAAASEMGNAVLGDDIIDIVLAGGADGTRGQDGLYLAYGAALCGGGKCNKALAALGLAGSSYIVYLTAGAGHMLCADAFGTDLTEEVDLKCRIDGYHIVVLADDIGVVDILNREYLDRRIIVDIIVDPLGAVGKGGDALAAVDLLLGVIDCSTLYKLNHGVGEHLGVYTEVMLGFECHARCIGDRTDAELDAGTVGYLLRYEVAYRDADIVQNSGRQNRKLMIVLNYSIDLRYVDLSSAKASGLAGVYLDEYSLGLGQHRLDIGAVKSEGEIAVTVHGRDFNAHSVVIVLCDDMTGNVPVIAREDIRKSCVNCLACSTGGKPAKAGHLALECLIGVKLKGINVKKGLDLDTDDITVLYSLCHCGHDGRCLRGSRIHAHEPSGLYLVCKLLRARKLLSI